MIDTLTYLLEKDAEYGVPVPPYPMPDNEFWFTPYDNLNIRNAPGGEYIGKLQPNFPVSILREDRGWAEIAPGQWVSMAYLRRLTPQ